MKDYFKQIDILAKINQGDENTFLEMYDFYAPKLFRHIYYRNGSKETSEDIAQQVFYKVWQYLLKPENKIDNLNAFLYKTANNLIADYYRKAERKNVPLDDILERKLSVEPSYTNEMDQNLDLGKIQEAIIKLSLEQQELITWRYFDDLSIDQIAKISGKSKNAIYVGLHRALKELKKITP